MAGLVVSNVSALNCSRCQRLNCNNFCSNLYVQGCAFQIGLNLSWLASRKQVSSTAIVVAAITSLDYYQAMMS